MCASGRRSTHREPSLPTNFCGTLKPSLRVPQREPLVVTFFRLWCEGMKVQPHPLVREMLAPIAKFPCVPFPFHDTPSTSRLSDFRQSRKHPYFEDISLNRSLTHRQSNQRRYQSSTILPCDLRAGYS